MQSGLGDFGCAARHLRHLALAHSRHTPFSFRCPYLHVADFTIPLSLRSLRFAVSLRPFGRPVFAGSMRASNSDRRLSIAHFSDGIQAPTNTGCNIIGTRPPGRAAFQ